MITFLLVIFQVTFDLFIFLLQVSPPFFFYVFFSCIVDLFTISRFYSISLPDGAKHNATRFRFWQASNAGKQKSVWSVDNFYVGPTSTRLPSLLDYVQDNGPQADQPGDPLAWTFVNNGQIGEFCDTHRRSVHVKI